jgi:hypothetical protein
MCRWRGRLAAVAWSTAVVAAPWLDGSGGLMEYGRRRWREGGMAQRMGAGAQAGRGIGGPCSRAAELGSARRLTRGV